MDTGVRTSGGRTADSHLRSRGYDADEAARVRQGYREAARIVRARAGNFYFAFLGQPPASRRALHAIYAFCREADDVTDDGRTAQVARAALAEMHLRLRDVYEGTPRAPGDLALQDAARSFGIERRNFIALLNGVERDLTSQRYATFDELYGYCFGVAASVGLLCLPVFGRRDALARRHAVDLGIGMQLTNILRDVREDAARDRIYLPAADLQRFGLDEQALTQPGLGGEEDGARFARLDALIRFEVQRARRFMESGSSLLPLLEPANRFCPAVLAAIYGKLLDRIERAGGRVLLRRISLSGPQKAWLAALALKRGR